MKKSILSLSILLSLNSYSQTKPQEKNITITMPVSAWETTLKGLAELKQGESGDIVNYIRQQAQIQLAPPPEPVKKDSTNKKH